MEKKKKRYIIQGLLILLILLLIAPKAFDKTQQYFKDKHMKTASIDYIREKYGVEAEFEKIDYHHENESELAYVRLKDGDKKFQVYRFTENKTETFSDTYQYDEICDAFAEYISETYPGGRYSDIEIMYPSQFDFFYHWLWLSLDQNTRFDGSNLQEILKDCKIKFTMYYVDTEFTDCELFEDLQKRNVDAAFVSFDTKEHLDEFLNSSIKSYIYTEEEPPYYAADVYYAPHITHIWRIDEGKSIRTNYQLKEGDGFLYYCPVASVSFQGTNAEILAYNYSNKEAENILERFASKAYMFNDFGWDPMYVYIPVSEIPDYESLSVLWFASNPGGPVKGIHPLFRYGDYAVFILSSGFDPSWALIKKTEGQ